MKTLRQVLQLDEFYGLPPMHKGKAKNQDNYYKNSAEERGYEGKWKGHSAEVIKTGVKHAKGMFDVAHAKLRDALDRKDWDAAEHHAHEADTWRYRHTQAVQAHSKRLADED